MSNRQPVDFSGYLAAANAVTGPGIPDRPNHANFVNACLQEGMSDASSSIYDKLSFASVAPMTFERRCSSWLGIALGKAMDRRHEDLYLARDIIARTRAALVEVQARRIQTETEIREIELKIEAARAPLLDPDDQLHDPLWDVRFEPGREDPLPAKDVKHLGLLWSRGAKSVSGFVRAQLARTILWIALVAGEVGLIYGIAMQLGDAELTGVLVAVSLSALSVGTGWLAIPTLLRPASSRSRKVLSSVALVLYFITILGLGWLRFVQMRPEVIDLLERAADDRRSLIAVPWYGDLLFYLLWVALPLALTLTLALLETHYSDDVQHDSRPEARGESAPATAQSLALNNDRNVTQARGQLVGHLKYLRAHRSQLQERLITLKAEEAHGNASQEDTKLNETSINERTRLHLLSLPEMIGEGFIAYLKGLERGFSDPTMTAHIQEAADDSLVRYMDAASSKVNEYLVYLNDHNLQTFPEAMHAGEL